MVSTSDLLSPFKEERRDEEGRKYLTCLTTSRSQTDKLAFDVGLREHATGKSSELAKMARNAKIWESTKEEEMETTLQGPRSHWSGSNIRWGQAFRLRHLTTGHYLALTEDQGLILQDRGKSDTKSTAFSFRASKEIKEKLDSSHKRDIEGMGVPEIKYGDSVCFVQHVASGLWVTYKAQDAKTSRLGPLKRKGNLGGEEYHGGGKYCKVNMDGPACNLDLVSLALG
ncbi:hypothetical protein CB1_004774007 [Camelus ferus]|nr:hypothetical protein CB1_004774007 [Camelus ferus]